jgi:FtsZ-interacting cell division protein ZipA
MVISDFQLSIIAVGVLAVAGVFAYNRWQEHRYRRNTERGFSASHADVLLEPRSPPAADSPVSGRDRSERVEPVDAAAPPHDAVDDAVEPQQAAAAPPVEEPDPTQEPTLPLVHPLADWVLGFDAAGPVAPRQLWQAARDALAQVHTPVRLLGWNGAEGRWQALDGDGGPDGRHWRIALQLADRRGALDQDGIGVFLRGIQQLADRFMAVTDVPDAKPVAVRAQELDAFCAGVDVQIGLHVVANDAAGFPPDRMRASAAAAGMALGADGVFHGRDEAGRTRFTMGNLEPALFAGDPADATVSHGLTFNLDVPRVADGAAAFDAMVAAAQRMGAALNGTVVDDNRAPLGQKALDGIRARIVEFQDLMSRQGIAAGSATADRLFH